MLTNQHPRFPDYKKCKLQQKKRAVFANCNVVDRRHLPVQAQANAAEEKIRSGRQPVLKHNV